MVRTEFVPKVVVNPYGFARICTALFPWVALKRLKKNSYGLYMSSCGLVGSVLVFRAEGSGFEDSSKHWFLYLWKCHNSHKHSQSPLTMVWHIRISVSMRAGRTADILTKSGQCYYTFWVFHKKIQLRWDGYH